jgi:putative transposase
MVRKPKNADNLYGYTYEIYPDEEQITQINKTFGCVRFIYNYYLSQQTEDYKKNKLPWNATRWNNHCNQVLKDQHTWLKEVDKFAITNVLIHLAAAYKNCYVDHNSNPPSFKSKHSHYQSYITNMTNNNIKVDHDNRMIQLPKLGKVKAHLHREFNGIIKNATISRTPDNRYFVSLLINVESLPNIQEDSNNIIAFDVGIKDYLVDNNGNKVSNPKYYKNNEKKLAQRQHDLSKKQKGSKKYEKQRLHVAKVHSRIANCRTDFLHKLSYGIVKENQIIISEDLSILSMSNGQKNSKGIYDASWNRLFRMLEYKAKKFGKIYHQIEKYFPSSQICSVCGHKNVKVKDTSVREFDCDCCGQHHDRDVNASINILNKGLQELGITQRYATGTSGIGVCCSS